MDLIGSWVSGAEAVTVWLLWCCEDVRGGGANGSPLGEG